MGGHHGLLDLGRLAIALPAAQASLLVTTLTALIACRSPLDEPVGRIRSVVSLPDADHGVVRLDFASGAFVGRCLGTSDRAGRVLTARHCLPPNLARDVAMRDERGAVERFTVRVHPLRDLALLSPESVSATGPWSIVPSLDPGDRVWFARSRDGRTTTASTTIVAKRGESLIIAVSMGPCAGDSGGPLWATDPRPRRLAGVLTQGNDCSGHSMYQSMTTVVTDWLAR